MSALKPFTPEQREALRDLLGAHPQTWKAVIRNLWAHSDRVSGDHETALYQLRNSHGPEWLRQSTADLRAALIRRS